MHDIVEDEAGEEGSEKAGEEEMIKGKGIETVRKGKGQCGLHYTTTNIYI